MPGGSSRNQTLSFLLRRFAETGIRPQTKLGQNFLIDLNLLRILLETAQLGPDDVVLEVGTGTGSLTRLVAERVAAVVTVEADPQLFQLAGEELHGLDNVTMLRADALEGKNRLNAEMLDTVARHVAAAPGRRLKLVANLPYNIATPLITNLLALEEPPRAMIVTVQKELADRIVAPPGVRDYGALSVWVQSQCRAEIVRVMSPTVFWPRPKVHSAILRIELDAALRARIADRRWFHQFVRAMFLHRRKLLRFELLTALNDALDKPRVDRLLASLQLDPTTRAEQLSPEAMIRLADAVRAEISD